MSRLRCRCLSQRIESICHLAWTANRRENLVPIGACACTAVVNARPADGITERHGRHAARTSPPMRDSPCPHLGNHRMGISGRMAYLPHRCIPDSPLGDRPAGGEPGPPAVTLHSMKEGRSMTTYRILGWVVTVTVALI